MPDLASMLASTVIFLFTPDGQVPIGTAFIVGYPLPSKPGRSVPIVVTAKHVVGDLPRVVGRFTAKSGEQPAKVLYDLTELRATGDLWEHPDAGVDLVALRSLHFDQTSYQAFPLNLVAGRDTLTDEDIKVTDRVIFPSLLVNFMGTTQNFPITRDGTIALMPRELVPIEYDVGQRRIKTRQEVLLLDATSVPGASGSPVFLWPGPRLKQDGFHVGGAQPWLIAIMHGFYPAQPQPLVGVQVNRVVPAFAENSGIAVIFPSWRLREILASESVTRRIATLDKD